MSEPRRITLRERAALDVFAAIYGRYWKRELRAAWESGNHPNAQLFNISDLQHFRNAKYGGPRGLDRYRTKAQRKDSLTIRPPMAGYGEA